MKRGVKLKIAQLVGFICFSLFHLAQSTSNEFQKNLIDFYADLEKQCSQLPELLLCLQEQAKFDEKFEKDEDFRKSHPNLCYRPSWSDYSCWFVSPTNTNTTNQIYRKTNAWPKHITEYVYAYDPRLDCHPDDQIGWQKICKLNNTENIWQFPSKDEHPSEGIICENNKTSKKIQKLDDLVYNAKLSENLNWTFDKVLRHLQMISTFISFIIFLVLISNKKLKQPRHYIHMNLILSYFLRSIINMFQVQFGFDNRPGLNDLENFLKSSIDLQNSTHFSEYTEKTSWDYVGVTDKVLINLIYPRYLGIDNSGYLLNHYDVSYLLDQECKFFNSYKISFTPCRLISILTQYLIISNYFWCLVEGVFLALLMELNTFFYGSVSYEKFIPFFLMGWVAPLFPTLMWTVLQASYYSNKVYELEFPDNSTQLFSIGDCWIQSWLQPVCLQHHWISELVIEIPIILSLLLNFYIFIKVLSMISSMNKHQKSQSKIKLMKSTMTLIPLLGLFYLATMLLQDCSYNVESNLESRNNLKTNPAILATKILSHRAPAIIVACIYCFFNGEVNELLKLYFQKLALGREIDIDALRRRSTISNSSRRSSHRRSFEKNNGKNCGSNMEKNNSRTSAIVGEVYENNNLSRSSSRNSSRRSTIFEEFRYFTRSFFISTRHNTQRNVKNNKSSIREKSETNMRLLENPVKTNDNNLSIPESNVGVIINPPVTSSARNSTSVQKAEKFQKFTLFVKINFFQLSLYQTVSEPRRNAVTV